MTDQTPKINGQKNGQKTGMIAPLHNVALFNELLDRLMNRQAHLPGIATFHGPSGYGKTFSATFGAHKFRAYYIEVGDSWTRKTFLEKLITEMGEKAYGTIPNMVDQVVDILIGIDRPIILDEFDIVVRKNYVELIREIYNRTHAPIVLIGEERLPMMLQKWERFHNRILDWVPAQPLTREEMRTLSHFYAEVEIADDLLDHVFDVIEGRARRACVNIARINEWARQQGLNKITLKDWGNRPVFIGKAAGRASLSRGRV